MHRSRLGRLLAGAGWGLGVAVVVTAPLLAGGVHRPTQIALFTGACLGILALSFGLRAQKRVLRLGTAVILPVIFLVIPLLQSIPLPMTLRRLVDAKGTTLLTEHAATPPAAWPLSLDPPATRANAGRAAAALVAFVIAFHLASGKSRRHLVPRAVALTGVAAVLIGLAHKILGAGQVYGALTANDRSLLMGPFVNPNHTAELLELAAFACLACSFHKPTALNRFGWMVGMVLCAGGAVGTLSRGAVLALIMAVAMFVFWRYRAAEPDGQRHRRAPFVWGLMLLGLIVLSALSLGSSQLIERFRTGTVGGDTRFQLWRDAWHVIAAHPAGIGRGAFDRVFPVYRTLHTEMPVRFAFVENEPLQMLVDGGWLFFAGIVAGFGVVVYRIVRRGRRDKVEAALLAGVFAVLIHSLLDFGLETPGVLLPFTVTLGAILGRAHDDNRPSAAARFKWPIVALASLGLVVGIGSVAHGSYDDFDALLRNANARAKPAIVERAERVHPIDYFYAMAHARLEPIKSPSGGPSPRFRALNRALALCPQCQATHVEVARNLWALGRRGQALLEWRSAIEIQSKLLRPVLGELFSAGARPEELASLAASRPARMIEIADFLSSVARIDDAMIVLNQAEAAGVATADVLVVRAQLELKSGHTQAAIATVAKARAASVRDPRLEIVDADLQLGKNGGLGPEAALARLDAAAVQYPFDLDVQRKRLDLVMSLEKWQAADRALQGFREALYQNRRDVSEAYTAAARVAARLSRWTEALSQYRLSVAQAPWNVTVWLEYGQTAEAAGRDTTAREAYAEAARLRPSDPSVVKALRALDERMAHLQELGGATTSEGAMKTAWYAALVAAICFEGLGRKYLPQIPSVVFYFVKDAILLFGFIRFRPPPHVSRVSGYFYRGFKIIWAVGLVWTVIELFNPEHGSVVLGLIGMRAYWLWWFAPPLIAHVLADEKEKRRAIYVLLGTAAAVAAFAAIQFAFPSNNALNIYSVVEGEEVQQTVISATGRGRVSSTFSYITGFSDFMILIPTLIMSLGLDAKERRLRRSALIVTCMCAAVVPMSGARVSVMIGAGILVIAAWSAGLFFTRVGRRLMIGGVAAAVLAVVAFPDAFIGVQSRFESAEETNERYVLAAAAVLPPIALAKFDYPAFGLGTGMLQNARGSMRIPVRIDVEAEVGRYLVELGPLGYLLIWTTKLGLAVALFRANMMLRRAGRRGAATAALCYALLAMIGNFAFDHIWQALFFMGCGFVLAEVIAVMRARAVADAAASVVVDAQTTAPAAVAALQAMP